MSRLVIVYIRALCICYDVIYLYSPNWIKIYGSRFSRGQYVLCGWQDDDLPMFGLIKDITVIAECPLLALERLGD